MYDSVNNDGVEKIAYNLGSMFGGFMARLIAYFSQPLTSLEIAIRGRDHLAKSMKDLPSWSYSRSCILFTLFYLIYQYKKQMLILSASKRTRINMREGDLLFAQRSVYRKPPRQSETIAAIQPDKHRDGARKRLASILANIDHLRTADH